MMTPMDRVESFIDSTPLLRDPPTLRNRAADDGYLCFRQLIDRSSVMALRADFLAVCDKHGFLKEGSNVLDGVAKEGLSVVGSVLRQGPYFHFYRDVLALRSFHAMVLQQSLIKAFETLFGEPVLAHARTIGRVVFPNTTHFTTGPHQDFVYIQGTPNTWTCWIALGDFVEELGPVAVMRGSHKFGLKRVDGAFVNGLRIDLPDGVWVSGAVEAGDVIAFHSHTFHQGRDNLTNDPLRLSIDARLQPASEPFDTSSFRPHLDFSTWAEIYEHWSADDPLKYYWKRPLRSVLAGAV